MQWTSIVAIYALVWVMTAFISLPFGVRTAEEMGIQITPGHADSAPANFRGGRLALRSTIIAAVVTGLWVLNYTNGWIVIDDIDWIKPPPELQDRQS